MPKARGRPRQQKGVIELSRRPEVDETAPDADGTVEVTFSERHVVDLDPDNRIAVRLELGSWKQLVDFAMIQQIRLDGKWHDVVRYDCAHGEVHAHVYRKGQKLSTRKRICGLSDIEAGYEEAKTALFDGWIENGRRYRDG